MVKLHHLNLWIHYSTSVLKVYAFEQHASKVRSRKAKREHSVNLHLLGLISAFCEIALHNAS